jgi:hypothetical protein
MPQAFTITVELGYPHIPGRSRSTAGSRSEHRCDRSCADRESVHVGGFEPLFLCLPVIGTRIRTVVRTEQRRGDSETDFDDLFLFGRERDDDSPVTFVSDRSTPAASQASHRVMFAGCETRDGAESPASSHVVRLRAVLLGMDRSNGHADGESRAREELLQLAIPLVETVVREDFSGSGYSAEELFRPGYLGLLNAVYNFDLAQGQPFLRREPIKGRFGHSIAARRALSG